MTHFWTEFVEGGRRVLLLQGPIGPFFTHLKHYLETECHKTVYKINFNQGDAFYAPAKQDDETIVNYQGGVEDFSHFLATFVKQHQIDAIVCFGDGRIYHKLAKAFCKEQPDVTFWAFEEGYLRPHFITFEKWGVNYNSTLSRKSSCYIDDACKDTIEHPRHYQDAVEPVAANFWTRAKMAARYYYEMYRGKAEYPEYIHHRETKLRVYLGAWLKTGVFKKVYKIQDRAIAKKIQAKQFGDFYIFPLQVHNDSQIVRHGRGLSIPEYIRKVIHSFAKNAPDNTKLVIKHHPMDRGFNNYQALISRLAIRKGIADRVVYVHEVSMPDLLRAAKGMVVINSTCGISALIHRLPVKVIGNAHYDIPPLTANISLDHFWRDYQAPNPICIDKYLQVLRNKTQLNGTFYNDKQMMINKSEL